MEVEKKMRDYMLENFLFTDDQSALVNNDSFMQKGIVDSTGILEVIHYMEEEFGMQIEDDEMIPENLDSIDNLVTFIARKQVAN